MPSNYSSLAGALTSLDNVKEFLGLSTTTDDPLLTNLIAACLAKFEAHCRRRLVAATVTGEIHDGSPQRTTVFLREYPAASVTAVSEDGGETTLSASDYQLIASTGELVRKASSYTRTAWRTGEGNILVSYTGGHATTPADLVHAATMQVALDYRHTKPGGNWLGQRQVQNPDSILTIQFDAIDPKVAALLERHVRRDVA